MPSQWPLKKSLQVVSSVEQLTRLNEKWFNVLAQHDQGAKGHGLFFLFPSDMFFFSVMFTFMLLGLAAPRRTLKQCEGSTNHIQFRYVCFVLRTCQKCQKCQGRENWVLTRGKTWREDQLQDTQLAGRICNIISVWWLGTFFHIWGKHNPNRLSYFSEGLKPPTRYVIHVIDVTS